MGQLPLSFLYGSAQFGTVEAMRYGLRLALAVALEPSALGPPSPHPGTSSEKAALTLYRGAGTALESLPNIAWRAASYLSQAALSASAGMVTTSP